MRLDLSAVTSARARINRVRWWWQRHMGWPGGLAALLLLAAAVLVWAVRPAMAATQRELLRAHVQRLDETARLQPTTAGARLRDPRDAVRDALPPENRRAESIATLLALLDKAKVAANSAEYVAEDQAPGLVRVRVTLPVEGGYGPARALIASILNELPHAALDGLELERPVD